MGDIHRTAAQRAQLHTHLEFLRSLRKGDTVQLSMGSREMFVAVINEWHSADWDGFGSPESFRVTVGYGIGRWNIDISPNMLMPVADHGAGYALKRVTQ